MPRTGWAMRGVPHVESVAEHSFGVAFVALALADVLEDDLDLEKVLVMAVLHDLAEVRLTDLPAYRRAPDSRRGQEPGRGDGHRRPAGPAARCAGGCKALWQEFEDSASPEGRLVRDADKLEMMVQCLRYELAGSRGLDEFWQAMDRREWHYPLCAELYGRLREMRP